MKLLSGIGNLLLSLFRKDCCGSSSSASARLAPQAKAAPKEIGKTGKIGKTEKAGKTEKTGTVR